MLDVFKQFKLMVEKQFSLPIKCVHSDWGGEFRSQSNFLCSQGIVHRVSFPHTHEQNMIAEL